MFNLFMAWVNLFMAVLSDNVFAIRNLFFDFSFFVAFNSSKDITAYVCQLVVNN